MGNKYKPYSPTRIREPISKALIELCQADPRPYYLIEEKAGIGDHLSAYSSKGTAFRLDTAHAIAGALGYEIKLLKRVD